ncbi:hypothetical protein F4604DRAFT_1936038 [Suillus subluteus]|nr:hypothetical protein F4604DRAFT_1936038 [Suillus subluteus]
MSLASLGSNEAPSAGYEPEHPLYVYDSQLCALTIFSGVPTFTIDFVGYLLLGARTTLYPLYGPPTGHDALRDYLSLFEYVVMPTLHHSALEASPDFEVPVFILANRDAVAPALNLPWDGIARENEPRTTIYHARYPMGHFCPLSEIEYKVQFTLPEIDTLSVSDSPGPGCFIQESLIPTSCKVQFTLPDIDTLSISDSPGPGCFVQESLIPTSCKVQFTLPEIDMVSVSDALGPGCSIQESSIPTSWMGSTVNTVSAGPSSALGTKSADTDTWVRSKKKVAAGHLNIHTIMQACPKWRKVLAYLRVMLRGQLLCTIWPQCLVKANITAEELETVLTTATQVPMEHSDVLLMASPWLSQFLYDTRRVVQHSMDDNRAGFGLGADAMWGLALRDKILGLLQMFICPFSNALPLPNNGLALFFREQIAKEIMYHIVFHTTTTCRVRLVMADLDTATFRHALYPPLDTLALLGSILPDSLYVTTSVLFGLVDSHDLMAFLDLSLREVTTQKELQQDKDPIFFPGGGQSLMEDRMHHAQMEVSLFSSTIANTCEELETRFHSDKHTVGPKQPSAVNTVGNVGAGLAPSLVKLGCFQPSKGIKQKCNAWLLTSSYFQSTTKTHSNASQRPLDSAHTLEPEYLPISKDIFLSLPHFLKSWVDHITYCTYMSASLAETKPPHPNVINSFKAKESKSLDLLRSDIHILDLKKHHAQTEVDMLSEALSRIAESEGTNSDCSSGSVVVYGRDDDWSDDWFSSSYDSSNASALMDPSQARL